MHSLSVLFSLFALYTVILAQDFSCGPNKPCKLGCCGKNNVCGLGPDYCGAGNCQSECNAKSECDPGWGSQWAARTTCPLNVCCSKFGFCGTTQEFCGTKQVTSPSCGGTSSNQRTIGYYEGWSVTRGCDQMYPENLPIGAYTHLNFAFAFIDPNTFAVAPMDTDQVPLYKRLTGLKNRNPGLQVWISIGGWSMNDPDQPTRTTFSDLAGSTAAQSKFFASLISFMSTYGFDGVDIDWEYPVAEERSGRPEDFANYVSFLKNLRSAFAASGHNYGVTITIPSSFWYLQHFDVVNIAAQIDWFNIMSYDLHGTWDSTSPYVGSIIGAHTNLTEIDQALKLLWRNNIDPSKVVLGLGFYGRSFTLSDPSCTTAGCPFSGGAPPGECTASSGTLSFAEIQRLVAKGAKVTLDKTAAVKNVVYDTNNWVSYDDAETFKMKIDYANSHCLGGTMVWAASTDDKAGTAAAALSGVTGRKDLSLRNLATTSDPITSCVFSECGDGNNCPAGTRPAVVANHPDQSAAISIGAGNNACRSERNDSSDKKRVYCCPPNDPPTCRWGGTSPFCNGHCDDDEVEVATGIEGDGKECWTGHKALCCKKKTSTKDWGSCHWEGKAPSCKAAGCDDSNQELLTSTTWGQGGEQPCSLSGAKSYCCSKPAPFKNCEWNKHGDDNSLFQNPFVCQGKCPSGKQLIATTIGSCITGSQVFCCDTESTANNPTVTDFQNKLNAFKSDPTCKVGSSKRDLTLAKRASSGYNNALSLSPIIAGSTSRTTGIDLLLSDTFDNVYGNANNIHFSNITVEQSLFPDFDINDLVFDALCQGGLWVQGFNAYRSARTEVCTELPGSRKGRRNIGQDTQEGQNFAGESNETNVVKRNLWGNNVLLTPNANLGRPTTGAVMNAVIQGQINPAYVLVDRLNGQDGHLLIEIAFDIRNNPGLQETPNDIFAGVHLHVDNMYFENGHNYPGVQFGSIFHAQQIYLSHGQRYRVVNWNTRNADEEDRTNQRAGICECDGSDADGGRWWLGLPGTANDEVSQFGRALRTRNIITDDLLQGLVNPSTYHDDREGRLFATWGFDYTTTEGQDRLSRSVLAGQGGLYTQNFNTGPYQGNIFQGEPMKLRKRAAEMMAWLEHRVASLWVW